MMIAASVDSVLGLLPHHLAHLRESGLAVETIRAAGITSETSAQTMAVELNRRRLGSGFTPALRIPFLNMAGVPTFHRFRLDTPQKRADGTVRYLSPSGQGNRLYFPPGSAARLEQPDLEVLITEGEKKALAIYQAGFQAVGLIGVYGWRVPKHEQLLPEFEPIGWNGRRVTIAFDSDLCRNHDVKNAAHRLAAALANRGAVVRIAIIPEATGPDDKPIKAGIDDYLAGQADPTWALRQLIDTAVEPEPIEPSEAKLASSELDPAPEAARYLATITTGGYPRLRFLHSEWLLYRRGRYETVDESEVRTDIIRHLNGRYTHVGTSHMLNLVQQVQAIVHLPGRKSPPCWIEGDGPPPVDVLVARNGLVHLDAFGGDKPLPHTPRFLSRVGLDYDYQPNAPPPTAWEAFLEQLWPDDPASIDTLGEWFGYCLTADTSQQKMFGLFGPKRSGKGTIARVLRATVGAENVVGPTLGSFVGPFGLQPLIGKSLAIFSDARLGGRADQAVIVERLLSISGEDSLTVDRKHRSSHTCILPTRLMLVSNELPRLIDSSGALASRIVALELRQSFYGREEIGLTERLLGELPSILLWALEGRRRLKARGYFVQPQSAKDVVDELDELGSPVGVFVRERCVVAPEFRSTIGDLFQAWQAWCAEKNIKEAGTEQRFGRDLTSAVPSLVRRRWGGDGARCRGYEGIGLQFLT